MKRELLKKAEFFLILSGKTYGNVHRPSMCFIISVSFDLDITFVINILVKVTKTQ